MFLLLLERSNSLFQMDGEVRAENYKEGKLVNFNVGKEAKK